MRSRAQRTLLLPFLTVAAAGSLVVSCGGSDSVTSPKNSEPVVATLSLSDAAVTVEVGFSQLISATVKSSRDSVLSGIPIAWSSDNPAVATVTGGSIDGLAVGSARITATASGKSATALVTVIPTVVNSIALSRFAAALAPGRTLQLTADALDSRLRPIPGRVVTFASSDESVAQVSATGLVTTRSVGAALITASADGKQQALKLTVSLPTSISIPLRAATPAGLLKVTAYSVKLRHADDSLTGTSLIGTAGSISGSMVLADTLQFLALSDATLSWPGTITAARGEMPASIPVVFIPQGVTLTSGTFSGTSIFTNMTAAVAHCPVNSDQCRSGFFSPSFRTGVIRWASFPIPVTMGDGLDTATIWNALRAMETAAGKQLFVPNDSGSANWIEVKAGSPPGASGFGGYTQWTWDSSDRMTHATVWLADRPSRSLVQHEFVHALGFFHTCSWASVMGGYGCPQSPEVTSSDIAYISLASAVYDAERDFRLPDGQLPCGTMSIWAAVQGQPAIVSCSGDSWLAPDVIRSTRVSSSLPNDRLLLRQDSAP